MKEVIKVEEKESLIGKVLP